MNVSNAKDTINKKKGARLLLGILISFFAGTLLFPSLAFAVSTTPTTAEPFCYSYKTSSTAAPLNRCLATLSLCTTDSASYTVLSTCGRATAPDPTTVPPAQVKDSVGLLQKAWSAIKSGVSSAASSLLDATVGRVLQGIAWLIMTVAGFFLQSMAAIMDYSIGMTIDSNLMGGLAFVNVGWTLIRDFSNMFFIFALLYIAIKTVLGLAGGSTKSWVAHLIIAALLINFSLFLTKVVIDAGNVVAVSFWDKLKVQQGTMTINSASAKFLQGLDIQTILTKEKNLNSGAVADPSHTQMAMLYVGGSIFMFIAGYVFLAGALMMVTRTISLILLMVFSPFAFLAFALPGKFSSYGGIWLESLIKNTFVAPLFIFMLYLNSILIDSVDLFKLSGAQGQTFSGALTGNASNYAIIYNFILLIGFLLASLHIANKYAGEVGAGGRAWASRITKGVAGATTVATVGTAVTRTSGLARDAGGRFGKYTRENERINQLAEQKGVRGMMGRGLKTIGDKAERSSYDPRATKVGQHILSAGGHINAGKASGAGGYKAAGSTLAALSLGARGNVGTDREKQIYENAERIYKNNPKAKEAYLRANLGTMQKKDADTGETTSVKSYDEGLQHKEVREKVAREQILADARKTITDKTKEQKELEEKVKNGRINKEEAAIMGGTIAEAVGKAMAKLNSKEVAEMLPMNASNTAFLSNLRKQDIHAIHQQELEGKYATASLKDENGNPVNILDRVASGVMKGKNEDTKKYLTSTEGQRKLFNFDVEKYKPEYELEQKNKARIADVDAARTMALEENTARDAAERDTLAQEKAQSTSNLRDKFKNIREQHSR